MAEQLTTDHWHLFQDHFIGHLKLFAVSFRIKQKTNSLVFKQKSMKNDQIADIITVK